MLMIGGVLVGCMIMLVVILILVSSNYKLYKYYRKFKDNLFWNSFLRYLLTSILKLMVASATTLSLIQDWEAKWVQAAIAIILLIVLGSSPLWVWGIIYKNRSVLAKPSTKQKIGSLYAGLNLNSMWQSSLMVIFLGRRIFFIILIYSNTE